MFQVTIAHALTVALSLVSGMTLNLRGVSGESEIAPRGVAVLKLIRNNLPLAQPRAKTFVDTRSGGVCA